MKEEIVAGIKNAMERGFSLESAVQSFINAGYNEIEVKEAASSLTLGANSVMALIQPQKKPEFKNSLFSKKPEKDKTLSTLENKTQNSQTPQSSTAQNTPSTQSVNSWEGVNPNSPQQTFQPSSKLVPTVTSTPTISQIQRKPQKSRGVVVLLLLIPLILILLGGIIAFLIFKDKIISFITSFF